MIILQSPPQSRNPHLSLVLPTSISQSPPQSRNSHLNFVLPTSISQLRPQSRNPHLNLAFSVSISQLRSQSSNKYIRQFLFRRRLGIPKALLEKVRQKQAAKALLSMTRSADKEKELSMYSRLPEIARLTRNLFVSEKKGVLPLETVTDKLGNCYRAHLTKGEMEEHLRLIEREIPGWLVVHLVRNCAYVKLAKGADLSVVVSRLERLAKEKSET